MFVCMRARGNEIKKNTFSLVLSISERFCTNTFFLEFLSMIPTPPREKFFISRLNGEVIFSFAFQLNNYLPFSMTLEETWKDKLFRKKNVFCDSQILVESHLHKTHNDV